MKNNPLTLIAGILGATLLTGSMLGCDSGSTAGTGKLTLRITDAPVDGAEHVYVAFAGVEIKAGNEIIDITYDAPRQIDLLALTGGVAETIVDGYTLPAGQVQWVRLKVVSTDATESSDPTDDTYIVVNGVSHPLTIPSGDQNGLKLNRPITIPDGGVATFTIDFDLRKSVHQDSNGYKLRPTLRLVDNSTDGALNGTVDTSMMSRYCDEGDMAAIYVYEGDVATNDIDDDNSVQPVTTANVNMTTGSYTVAFLPSGNYTAAFTCNAGNDVPDTDDEVNFYGKTMVTITAGQTTTQGFVIIKM